MESELNEWIEVRNYVHQTFSLTGSQADTFPVGHFGAMDLSEIPTSMYVFANRGNVEMLCIFRFHFQFYLVTKL